LFDAFTRENNNIHAEFFPFATHYFLFGFCKQTFSPTFVNIIHCFSMVTTIGHLQFYDWKWFLMVTDPSDYRDLFFYLVQQLTMNSSQQ